MSSHYLSVILAWMKQNPTHLNWDLTFAIRPELLNDQLVLAHFSREGSALGDIEGEIDVPGSGITHVLAGYRMGPPLLGDLQAAYASPKVRQTITLEGGTHLIMDRTEGLLGLAYHDALDPLRVTQQMPLTANHTGVHADLGEGADTELDLGGGLPQRLAAGRFFNDFVSGLDVERRLYPLVDFQALIGNPYLRLRGSAVRTHASKNDGKPALVVFAGMENGPLGNFPTQESNYPFLFPDDLSLPVNATLLLSSRLLHRAAYAMGLEQMLEGGAFEAHFDEDKVLHRLDAKAGQLRVYPGTYESADYQFSSDEFVIPVGGAAPLGVYAGEGIARSHDASCCRCCTPDQSAVQSPLLQAGYQAPLSITFDHDEVRQHWKSYCSLTFRYRNKRDNVWITYSPTFQFDLLTLFHLVKPASAEESAGCLLLGHVLWPMEQSAEVTAVQGLPAGLPATVRKEINAFVTFIIKQAILEGLAQKLTAMIPEQVIEGMAFGADHRFVPFHCELPDGMALFANQSGSAAFRIVDPPVTLGPGEKHAFAVQPIPETVRWSLEALPGTVGDIGRIDAASGEYRAPPVHAMGGQQMRAWVIATDPYTGQRAMTLVTVVVAALTVNPLIHVCYIEDELTLTAGTLGGALAWSVVDPDGEGRGRVRPDEDGRRCTYTAGSLVSGNQTYVLDVVKVEDVKAQETRLIHVLVRQRRPELLVEVAEQLSDGRLRLQGWIFGQVMQDVEWTVPIEGEGQIDTDGRYTPPADPGARFALIMAKWSQAGFTFEGHLILPLPSSLHFEAMRRADSPAGLRLANTQSFGG